jgi:hypothetical protein
VTKYALALAALVALPAQTQEQPDVAIFATVHAKELRFTEVPEVKVTFPTDPQNKNVWNTEREHLPTPVQPYVTYRDIGIRLTITSTLPDIEKILDDALAPPPPAAPKKRSKSRR